MLMANEIRAYERKKTEDACAVRLNRLLNLFIFFLLLISFWKPLLTGVCRVLAISYSRLLVHRPAAAEVLLADLLARADRGGEAMSK